MSSAALSTMFAGAIRDDVSQTTLSQGRTFLARLLLLCMPMMPPSSHAVESLKYEVRLAGGEIEIECVCVCDYCVS